MASVRLKIQNGLNLTIKDREFVVLAGPGTSAIIRAIAGLDDVEEGEIFFDDRRIDALAPKDRDVAFLNRDYTPYPALSVFENLAIGLRRRNFAEAEITKRITAVAAALDLESHLEANAPSLSIEQRRFVGLARAMVRQPKVYLFDEPFAGLDARAAARGRGEILKLHQRSSATIVYATSAATTALAFGQRTVVLADGVIQQDEVAQQIYDAPENLIVARFFGDAGMNLVDGRLKEDRSGLAFTEAGDGTIAVRLPTGRFAGANDFLGKPVILGVRPENIAIEGSLEPGRAAGPGFRALVERVEPRGLGADIYLQTGAHALIARSLDRAAQAQAGQRLQFRVNLEQAHLFDGESGRRVTSRP